MRRGYWAYDPYVTDYGRGYAETVALLDRVTRDLATIRGHETSARRFAEYARERGGQGVFLGNTADYWEGSAQAYVDAYLWADDETEEG